MIKIIIKIVTKTIKISLLLVFLFLIKFNPDLIKSKTENTSINSTVDLNAMAMFIQSVDEKRIFSVINTYDGELTGYVYNCPLCSGKLACNRNLDLSTGLTTFNDEEYGFVRIIAASSNLRCGSIIRFNSTRVSDKPTLGIVLDRGMLGTDIDILVESVDIAIKDIGRTKVTYDVLRNGY